MRAIAVALLVLASASMIAVSGQDSAGAFRTAITLNGLQNFEAALIAFVNAEFKDLTLPDIHLEPKVPILGKIELDLTAITITDFHIPSASFSLTAPQTIGVGVSGTGLTVKLNFHWKQKDWPHTSDHGDLRAIPKQGDITETAAVSVSGGHPYFTSTESNVDFDKLDLHFSGHWDSWLYDLIADLFKSTLRKAVNDAVAASLKDIINTTINHALDKLPLHLYFGDGASCSNVDISTESFNVNANYVGLGNTFSVTDNSTGVACPINPVPLPDVDPQSHQLQFFLAQSVLNCALWTPYINNEISFSVPSTVTIWEAFIPQLGVLYPGAAMTMLLSPVKGQPTLNMATSGISLTTSWSMNQSVIESGNAIWVDNLEFDITIGVDLFVAKAGPKQPAGSFALYGNSTSINIVASVIDSGVGPISAAGLQTVIDFVEPLVVTFANGVLGAGFPIPLIPGIDLIEPSLFFGDGYIGIASDFTFPNLTAIDVGPKPVAATESPVMTRQSILIR